ncbi:MAG: protein jag [Candidatus Eremiobacteraeota bacterium]|nr:protein jag [Candidatus Eremiobacteraeota bacterium]
MDDQQNNPPGDGGGERGFGQRRRAGRSRRSGSGSSGPPQNRPPRRDFEPAAAPRPRPAAGPEPESVRPAKELLSEILVHMGVTGASVRYYARTEGEYLEVDGPDLANLIGRHGHTLEALNLIFNNIVNAGVKKDRHYFTIDAEGYRARRADLLKGLALATLERAMREKRAVSLEPMLPSERKVIHLALADNPFVSTESSGVEPERRVVVIPKSA